MAKPKVPNHSSSLLAVVIFSTLLMHPTAANFVFQDGFKIEMPVWFELRPRLRPPILLPYRQQNTSPNMVSQQPSATGFIQFPMIQPGRPEFTPVQQTARAYPLQPTSRSEYPMFQQTPSANQVYPVQSTVLPYRRVGGYSVVNWQTPKPMSLPDQNVQYLKSSPAQQDANNRMITPEVPPAPEEEEDQEDIQDHQESPEEN